MTEIKSFLDILVDDVANFAKNELVELVDEAKSDSKAFIKNIGELTEEYVKMRALGEINNDEFKELMEDLLDLNKMEYHKLSASAKVRAERIVNGTFELVVKALISVI